MYLSIATTESITNAINETKDKNNDTALILLGEKNRPDVDQMILALNRAHIPFFGGIFPGIISGAELHNEGAIIIWLPALAEPLLIKDLSSENISFPGLATERTADTSGKHTAVVLLDGMASHVSPFLSQMFNRLGNSVHYFGGGAGFSSLERSPCIFTPRGFFQDAAVVAFIESEMSLGVRHGCERAMGPIVATKTSGPVIKELNWENAFAVYRKAVEKDAAKMITKENAFETAARYPFGICKEGAEDIVRVIVSVTDEGELICGGDVPESAVLWIIKWDNSSLLQAAEQAAEESMSMGSARISHGLVVDCISRALLLGDDFGKELEAVRNKIIRTGDDPVLEGILSLGEISSYGEESLEYFNMTIVVGVMHE